MKTRIWELSDQKLKDNHDLSDMGPGLMICTYRTLLGQEAGGSVTRVNQLLSWVGGDGWDGVLALDEAHRAKNLHAQGGGKPSKTAVVIDALQSRLRDARVIYASATVATEPQNMQCLSRLGLWGPGTAFDSSTRFAKAMTDAGLPGLELLSVNLKLAGKYFARTLGFKGCEFQVVKVPMDPNFAAVYDACARQWMELQQDLRLLVPCGPVWRKRKKKRSEKQKRRAMGLNGMEEADGEEEGRTAPTDEEKAKQMIWMLFWATQQRFFRSLYVAAKVPTVIALAQEAIANGYAPVIGLQTTGESQIRVERERTAERRKRAAGLGPVGVSEVQDIEELSQCRGQMDRFLTVHMSDALGPGTAEVRSRHLSWLDRMGPRLPPNPLDQLVEGLGGAEVVAELTGRQFRRKHGRYEQTATSQRLHEAERTAFQRGTKLAAVISEAASVGISLHSDRREPTAHKRRVHFCLELAWGADRVMQQLGRTHRTNAMTGPLYKFVVTEKVGADTRFISTVARRLQSLGAICHGHEGATTKTINLREYNVESKHGDEAYTRLWSVEDPSPRYRKALRILEAVALNRDDDTRKFLNRCLSFELEIQHVLMDKFFELFNKVREQEVVESGENKTLDDGERIDEYSSKVLWMPKGSDIFLGRKMRRDERFSPQIPDPIISQRGQMRQVVHAAKLDGTYESQGIINIRGEAVEVHGPIKKYKTSDDVLQLSLPRPSLTETVAAGASHVAPCIVDGGDNHESKAVLANKGLTNGVCHQDMKRAKSLHEETTMSLVTLTLDRGLRFDRALEMLKGADAGGEGHLGGNGFYLSLDSVRPFLALDRGGGCSFKIIFPDVGRQAFVDKRPEHLLRAQYLRPHEAEKAWTRCYNAALVRCFPHGRQAPSGSVGLRIHKAFMLTFDVIRHWQLVQKLARRKRLRVVRAAITSKPKKHFMGVMLSEKALRRLEGLGLPVVDEEGEAAAEEGFEDKQLDVITFFEEWEREVKEKAMSGMLEGRNGKESVEEQGKYDKMEVVKTESNIMDGSTAEGHDLEHEEQNVIYLDSDLDSESVTEIFGLEEDHGRRMLHGSKEKWSREDSVDSAGASTLEVVHEDDDKMDTLSTESPYICAQVSSISEASDGDVNARKGSENAFKGIVDLSHVCVLEDGKEDSVGEREKSRVYPTVHDHKTVIDVDALDDKGLGRKRGGYENDSSTAARNSASCEASRNGEGSVKIQNPIDLSIETGSSRAGDMEDEDTLVVDLLDMLDELKDEDIITKQEARGLRARAVNRDALVVEAFYKARECNTAYTGGQVFRKIALGM